MAPMAKTHQHTVQSASNKQMAKIYLTNKKIAICSHWILMIAGSPEISVV